MFFQKKSHPEEENVAKKSVKKMDTLVTGMILGGIIASIYGVKKLQEKQAHKDDEHTHLLPQETLHKDTRENLTKKRSILSRIFFGNK